MTHERRRSAWAATTALCSALAFVPAPVHAAALAPVVTGAVALLATPVGQVAAGLALSFIGNKISQAQAKPIADPGIRTTLAVGGSHPLTFPAGRIGIAGQRVYAGAWGNDNKYGVDVIKLSDLPVDGLETVHVYGQRCTIDWEAEPAEQGYPVLEYRGNGKDNLWVRFHDGSQTTADAYLVDKFGADAERPWTADAVGYGRAYMVVTWRQNKYFFASWPKLLAVVRGIRCYDRSKDSTAGGAGTHRRADPATWEFSRNPVVIADTIVFAGLSAGDEWVWGLQQALSAGRLPASAWIAAIAECNAGVDLAAGGSEPQWTVDFEVSVDQEPADVLDLIARCASIRFTEFGGVYKPLVGLPGSAVLSITDDDIVVTQDRLFEPFPALKSVHNAAVATYVEPGEAWEAKPAPEHVDAEALAADDGEKLVAGLSYPAVTSGTQAQRLAQAAVRDGRLFRRHAVWMPAIASLLECVDTISWTSAEYGYSAKTFLVEAREEQRDLDQYVMLRETDPSHLDWNPETDEQAVAVNPPLSPIRPPAQIVTGWQVFAATLDDAAGARRPTIRIEGPADLDDIAQVRFRVRLAATGGAAGDFAPVAYGAPGEPGTTRSWTINGTFLPATQYEVEIDLVPDRAARPTTATAWLSVTTGDVRFQTADLAAAVNSAIRAMRADLDGLRDTLPMGITSVAAAEGDALRWRQGLRTRVGATEAAVALEAEARADGDSANAALIGAVLALAEQGTASGLFKIEAMAGPSGVSVRFGVYLRTAVEGVYEAEAAFFIDIMDGGGTRMVSIADRHYWQDSAGNALALLDEDGFLVPGRIAAETVVASMIEVETITVDRFAIKGLSGDFAGAVFSNPASPYSRSGTSWGNLTGAATTVTVPANTKVFLLFKAQIRTQFNDQPVQFRFLRDGGELAGALQPIIASRGVINAPNSIYDTPTLVMAAHDTPAAGEHTYQVQWRNTVWSDTIYVTQYWLGRQQWFA